MEQAKIEQEKAKLAVLEEAERKKSLLPEEPAETNSDACQIILRLPGSGERVSRRFLKTEQVQVLYYYLESLGPEKMQIESHGNGFVIFQSMPRKEYTDMSKTLSEAGLYPKALL